MKLLITGAGGLLGSDCARVLPEHGHDVSALTRAQLDVTDAGAVFGAVEAVRPDAVLHCAGMTDVDASERDPEQAFRVNRDGARHVAEAAAAVGARMVYYSTDYVFDGEARTPYAPDAVRNPLVAYARSKAEGEDAVQAASEDHLVVRVSWLFGEAHGGSGGDFVRYVLGAARDGRTLRLVEDQRSRPSWTRNVALNTVELLDRSAAGIWHLCDAEDASRLEQAEEVLQVAGFSATIEPVTRAQLWPDVPRPAYSVLDLSATEELLGRAMMPWRESVRMVLERS